MRFRLLAAALLLCSLGTTLAGQQDLTGTWQGTATTGAGAQIRIVLRITRTAGGALEGQLFSIDQNPQPRTMGQLSVDGRVVKWKVDALSVTYEGTFTPDGNGINGTQIGRAHV